MSSTFDRLTRGENIKYIEGASNFERYFSRYDIQEQRYEAPARYDKKIPMRTSGGAGHRFLGIWRVIAYTQITRTTIR